MHEYKKLEEWRKKTGLCDAKPTKRQIVKHFAEELFEMCGFDKNEVEYFTEKFMDKYVVDQKLDDYVILDAMHDMKVFAINDSTQMGYNAEDCMSETVKEVTSRKGNYDKSIGKFIKVITGNEYKADYSKCKIA